MFSEVAHSCCPIVDSFLTTCSLSSSILLPMFYQQLQDYTMYIQWVGLVSQDVTYGI